MPDPGCELLALDLPRAEAVRAAVPSPDAVEAAARRARALGDPTRLTVALALREGGELCGCDLAWVAGRPQNLVSHHAGLLRREGLVHARRDGRMVMFSLTPAGAALVDAVLAGATA